MTQNEIELMQDLSNFIKETGKEILRTNDLLKEICNSIIMMNKKLDLIFDTKIENNNETITCEHSGISWDKKGNVL